MKKLIALIGVITLICSMAFPALANGSIGPLLPDIQETVPQTQNTSNSLQDHFAADDTAKHDAKWLQEVKELVEAVNNSDLSVSGLIEALLKLPVNAGNDALVAALANADFASPFAQNSLNYDGEAFYSLNGRDIPVKQTLVYEQLKGRNADEFQILLINPTTGQFVLIDLDPDAFNAETGEITVEFPFLGIYALIEK